MNPFRVSPDCHRDGPVDSNESQAQRADIRLALVWEPQYTIGPETPAEGDEAEGEQSGTEDGISGILTPFLCICYQSQSSRILAICVSLSCWTTEPNISIFIAILC